MDRTERFYIIDQLLCNQRLVTRIQFLDALGVSLATFKRDLEYMRDRLAAPIVWNRERRGYSYDHTEAGADLYQLPGLWFNTSEIQALLTMDTLLENLQPGILSNHVKPLRSRIRVLLDKGDHSVEEISKRIRVLPVAAKKYRSEYFQTISQALLTRRRLQIHYYSRPQDDVSVRDISPQRLVYYRDNWYLDSWCHWREALRSFSVDAIKRVEILQQTTKNIDELYLDQELASGYGIFSGADTRQAVLRFSPRIARWVSRELWHPQQQSHYDDSGYNILQIPYSQDTELLMDILKYGAEVEVLEPPDLRQKIIDHIEAMRILY